MFLVMCPAKNIFMPANINSIVIVMNATFLSTNPALTCVL